MLTVGGYAGTGLLPPRHGSRLFYGMMATSPWQCDAAFGLSLVLEKPPARPEVDRADAALDRVGDGCILLEARTRVR
jgi:hypothetical protein